MEETEEEMDDDMDDSDFEEEEESGGSAEEEDDDGCWGGRKNQFQKALHLTRIVLVRYLSLFICCFFSQDSREQEARIVLC